MNKKKRYDITIKEQKDLYDKYPKYPLIKKYKYLGIIIDTNINPYLSITELKEILDIYITRNYWPEKHAFNPYSLLQIPKYFEYSRIINGMAIFVP